jgi:hypothetical protein
MQIQVEKLLEQLPDLYSLHENLQKEHRRVQEKMKDMDRSINGKIKILKEKKDEYQKILDRTSEAICAIEKTVCGLKSLECQAKILNEENKNVNN